MSVGFGLLLTSCSDSAKEVATTTPTSSTTTTTTSTTTTTTSTTTPAPTTKAPVSLVENIATSPDGRFTYTMSYDFADGIDHRYNGVTSVGGEGLTTGPALGDPRDELDELIEMVFGSDDLVAWISNDANYGTQLFLGKVSDQGQIVDAHQLPGQPTQFRPGMSFDDTGLLTAPIRHDVVVFDPAIDPFFTVSSGRHWGRTRPAAEARSM
jgi:hypothetical protein